MNELFLFNELFSTVSASLDFLESLLIRPPRLKYSPEDIALDREQDYQQLNECFSNRRGEVIRGSLYYHRGKISQPCLVYAHGNSSGRLEGFRMHLDVLRAGLSLYVFDFSGCGQSEGDIITLGLKQSEDLQDVADYLRSKRISELVFWGRSMGAVSVLLYISKGGKCKAAVLDSPFSDLKHLVYEQVRQMAGIPNILVKGAAYFVAKRILDKTGYDLFESSPIRTMAYNFTPLFFIVGSSDTIINPEHSRQLYQAAKGTKLIEFVSGGHNSVRSRLVISKALDFLQKYLSEVKVHRELTFAEEVFPQNYVSIQSQHIQPRPHLSVVMKSASPGLSVLQTSVQLRSVDLNQKGAIEPDSLSNKKLVYTFFEEEQHF